DHHAAGADVTAAVVLVPFWGRHFQNVDVGTGGDVLHQWAALHRDGRDGFGVFHVVAPVAHEIHFARPRRQAEREIDTPHRGENVRHQTMLRRKSRDVLKHHGG